MQVHIIPGAFGLPSVSPYCFKLIKYLEVAGIEFETVKANLPKAPRGKVPFIVRDREVLTDTHLIIEQFEREYGPKLVIPQTDEQQAKAGAALRIAENSLYWFVLYTRFLTADGWKHQIKVVHELLPPVVGYAFAGFVKGAIKKQLHQVGITRLSDVEKQATVQKDLFIINNFIKEGNLSGSDGLSHEDIAVYAVLKQGIVTSYSSMIKQEIEKFPKILEWLTRIDNY